MSKSVYRFATAPILTVACCAWLLGGCGDAGEVAPTPDTGVSAPDSSAALDTGPTAPDQAAMSDTQPPPAGKAITAPNKVWTWVGFPEARCANDTPTGIGVNLNSASDKVLIFLKGGGQCHNYQECVVDKQATDLDGFDESKLQSTLKVYKGILDRGSPVNVFADWNLVFVPYCTGDFHAGNRYSATTQQHHVGHKNLLAYLARLVPTFAKAKQVVLAGTSAGGFGATLNYHWVQQAFGAIPVDMIADSGPMADEQYLHPNLQSTLRSTWGLDPTMPPDCASCTTGYLDDLLGYLGKTYPERRFGLVTSLGDATIRRFYAEGLVPAKTDITAAEYQAGLDHLADTVLAPYPNWKVFYVPGEGHVFVTRGLGFKKTTVDGLGLSSWTQQLVGGSTAWRSARP
jgi:hypothetical protein